MATDNAVKTVRIEASADRVLATIRDVASQTTWVPEIKRAEVLTAGDDGLPLTASFAAATPVGTDEYTLAYTHRADGMDWTLVQGKLQTGQEAHYTVVPAGDAACDVTFDLTVSHNLPIPGFLRRKVIGDLVTSTLTGLRRHLEG
jgi:ribosome-associated toxin RatA of RatAB toxin-antitoxin module